MKHLIGTLQNAITGERLVEGIIQLSRQPASSSGASGETFLSHSDSNGNFTFDLATIPHGSFVLTAFHKDSLTEQHVSITIENGKSVRIVGNGGSDSTASVRQEDDNAYLTFNLTPQKDISNEAGKRFFWTVFFSIIVLIVIYAVMHQKIESGPPPAIHATLTEHIGNALTTASIEDGRYLRLGERIKEIEVTVNAASTIFKSLEKQKAISGLEPHDADVVLQLFNGIGDAITQKNLAQIRTNLGAIDRLLRKEKSYFWQEDPLRLLELLFWATAATLMRLAISSSAFVRKGTFDKNAMPHNSSYIATVPIMAVLISIALSFVSVDLSFGEAGIKIDLRDISVSILIAALVGLAPWKASKFLEDMADAFFEKIGSLFSASTATQPAAVQPPAVAGQPPLAERANGFEDELTSAQIRSVQRALSAAIDEELKIDGILGKETRDAIETFSQTIPEIPSTSRYLSPELHARLETLLEDDLPKSGAQIESERALTPEKREEVRKALQAQGINVSDQNMKGDIDLDLRRAIRIYQSKHPDLHPNGLISDAVLRVLLPTE